MEQQGKSCGAQEERHCLPINQHKHLDGNEERRCAERQPVQERPANSAA
jgi:hypothetical protein